MADTPALAMQSALAPMAPTAPPLPQESPDMQRQRELAGKFESGIERQRQDFEKGQAALDPIRDRLLKVLENPIEAKAHLEKVKEAPKPEDYQKYSLQFASGMALLGAFAGKFTRAGGTAALDAFGSAVKGWQEGNLQAWHQGMEKWQADTERTLANNRVEIEKYSQIINNKRLTVEQMMAGLNIEAARFQNKVLFDATESGNYEQAFKIRDMLVKNAQNIQQSLGFFDGALAHGKQGIQQTADLLNKDPNYYAAIAKKDPEGLGKFKMAAETMGISVNPAPEQQRRPATGLAGYLHDFREHQKEQTGQYPTPREELQATSDYYRQISYGRAAGTQIERVTNAVNELKTMIPQALQASNQFDRGRVVALNKLYNDWKAGVSDPTLTDLELASFGAISAYVRAMNPQGVPRVADRLETEKLKLLSSAVSKEAYATQLRRMWTEAQLSEQATQETAKGPPEGGMQPFPGEAGGGAAGATGGGNVIRYDAQGKRLQ